MRLSVMAAAEIVAKSKDDRVDRLAAEDVRFRLAGASGDRFFKGCLVGHQAAAEQRVVVGHDVTG